MRIPKYNPMDDPVDRTALWPLLTGRAMLHLLSPGGRRARLSILIYHRVLPCQDPLFPEESYAQSFDQQMEQFRACFRIISLSDAIQGLRNGTLPPRAACVTFDDGYADNAEIALPILKKHGIPATFFVATGFLDGGRMFNDTMIELIRRAPGSTVDLDSLGLRRFPIGTVSERRQTIHQLLGKLKYLPPESRQSTLEAMSALIPVDLPRNLMMTSSQVRELHNSGMEIGGHTVNHPILAQMENSAACADIAIGKEMLEGIIRAPVRFFAYPNGKPRRDYLPDHVLMVKKLGFDAAVSTAHGAAGKGSDLYQLPRFTPWDRRPLRFALLMARNMLKTGETV
ncbi:MAG: Polysaccharide deacetylase [Nitrosospira multiformis]|jgi:peptidoglycan/xylan/chitin deacetylase (PgdA/CDA1 family)|nr:Polysaccharide deacetylase [Nitrosospira multiformis]